MICGHPNTSPRTHLSSLKVPVPRPQTPMVSAPRLDCESVLQAAAGAPLQTRSLCRLSLPVNSDPRCHGGEKRSRHHHKSRFSVAELIKVSRAIFSKSGVFPDEVHHKVANKDKKLKLMCDLSSMCADVGIFLDIDL